MKSPPKPIRRTQQALSLGIFFEALEPRLLLSGDWGAGLDSSAFDSQPGAQTDLSQANTAVFDSAGTLTIGDQGQSQSVMRAGEMVDVLRQAPPLQELAIADPTGQKASSAGQYTPGSSHAPSTASANLNGNASNLMLQTSRMVLPGVRELVFLNANVADYERLISSLQSGHTNRIIDVVVLPSDCDGIAQVSDILAGRTDLAAVHFITHGAEGQINLGSSWLNPATLQENGDAVAGWGSALTETGDILFYGCNVAAGSAGQRLLDNIAALTGADVAASADLTGSGARGGDWDLETASGAIEAEILRSSNWPEDWPHLLAAPTAANNTITINEDATYRFDANDFNFSDIDGDILASVRITSLETAGDLQLAGMDVSLNQVIDRLDIDAGNLTFTPAADANGPAYASFGFRVNDGTADSAASYSMAMDVIPLNDPPVALNDHAHLDFDGIDDFVAIPDSASLTLTNTLTMEAWIKADASANVNRMIINKEGEYEVALFADSTINWAFANTDPGWAWHNTGYVVPDGVWTHIAVAYDNGAVSTYVNGALVDLYSGSGAIGDAHATLDELRFGGRSNNPAGKYFDGRIDEVRIWNTVRTQGQIQASMDQALTGGEAGLVGYWNFNEGSGSAAMDLTGNGNAGTLIDGGAGTAGPQWTAHRTDQNTPITVTAANGLLSNDIDADGDSLTVTQVNGSSANVGSMIGLPSGANLTVGMLGDFIYDPNAAFDYLDNGQSTTDHFTYQADDGNGGTDTAIFTITVTGTADAPITDNVSATGNQHAASIAITLTGSDVDGTVAFYRLNNLPANGTLYADAALTTAAATGVDYAATGEALTLYFVPDGAWIGTTTFTYAAGDENGLLDATAAMATIAVHAVNDAPVNVGSSGPGDETDGGIDPDGDVDPVEADPEVQADEILPVDDGLPAPAENDPAFFRRLVMRDTARTPGTHPRIVTPAVALIVPQEVGRNENGSRLAGVEMPNSLKRESATVSEKTATDGAFTPVAMEFFANEAMAQELDRIQKQINDELASGASQGKLIIGAAAGVGASLFVGYVVWAFRGASLLLGALSAMPMWRCFDPLPVLAGGGKKRDEEEDAQDRENGWQDDEKPVQDLLGSRQTLNDSQGSYGRTD